MNDRPSKNALTSEWKNLIIFASGVILGSSLTLGGLLMWRDLRKPSVNSLQLPSISPSPLLTETPVNFPSPPFTNNTISSPPSVSSSVSPSVILPTPSSQEEKRVKFEPGTTGTTLKNQLKAHQSQDYLVESRQGQKLTLELQQGTVNIKVFTPDGNLLGEIVKESQQFNTELPRDGDYTIKISGAEDSQYVIKIDIL